MSAGSVENEAKMSVVGPRISKEYWNGVESSDDVAALGQHVVDRHHQACLKYFTSNGLKVIDKGLHEL